MTRWMAVLTMVISVAFTGVLVDWIARAKHARRLFFIDLGRERTPADDARARRLRIGNAIVTALGVAAIFAPEPLAIAGIVGAPLLSTAWLIAETIGAARSATRERVPGRFVVPLDAPRSALDYVSAPLEVANALVVIVPSALFAWVLARLPERVPAHWNAAGAIDRWASPIELWFFAGILLFDLALLWTIVFAVAKERWALPEREAERYAALQMERRRTMVRMLEWLFVAIDGGLAIVWMAIAFGSLHGEPDGIGPVVIAGVILTLAGTLVPLVVYVPRLVKTAEALRAIAGTAALGTHASGWRYDGLIYYAPDDPAVFVPKRDGIGQTLNMARPGAWGFLFTVVVLPVAISLVAVLLAS